MFRFDKYVNIVHHVEKVLCNIAVTPFVGVWIEMAKYYAEQAKAVSSLPSWECGLKLNSYILGHCIHQVTPFVGVWIEI